MLYFVTFKPKGFNFVVGIFRKTGIERNQNLILETKNHFFIISITVILFLMFEDISVGTWRFYSKS